MKISTETPAAPVRRKSCDKVIVAVKAEKVIAKAALAWALTHVVRPGDCVTLLAVFFQERTGMNWIVVFSARLEPSLIGLIVLGNDFFFFFFYRLHRDFLFNGDREEEILGISEVERRLSS